MALHSSVVRAVICSLLSFTVDRSSALSSWRICCIKPNREDQNKANLGRLNQLCKRPTPLSARKEKTEREGREGEGEKQFTSCLWKQKRKSRDRGVIPRTTKKMGGATFLGCQGRNLLAGSLVDLLQSTQNKESQTKKTKTAFQYENAIPFYWLEIEIGRGIKR